MRALLLALVLCACADRRGELGQACLPDGTCRFPGLVCATSPTVYGIPLTESYCRVRP